jgi:hypothetical protein
MARTAAAPAATRQAIGAGCIVGRQSESVSLEINGRQCLASTLPRHDNPSSAGERSEDRAAAPLDVRVG